MILFSLGVVAALIIIAGTQGFLFDWELLLEYVKVLWGWPAVVLVLGVILRKSLPNVFENGGKFEGFGISAEINERAKEAQESSQEVAAAAKAEVKKITEQARTEKPEGVTTTPMPEPGSVDFQDLITLAAAEPTTAMNQAWSLLGQRLVQVYDDPNYKGIPSRERQDEAVRETWNAKLLDNNWITDYADLRALRYRRGRRSPRNSVPFVVTAANLYAALDLVAIRKWAKENNISYQNAQLIFQDAHNAQEADTQPR